MVLSNPVLSAQEQKNLNRWSVIDASKVSDLPSIGLAGQSATIHKDRLLVLGGSNFPVAMPWEGGQKKYYDRLWIYQLGDNIQEIKQPVALKYAVPIAYATAILYKDEWILIGGETPEGRIAEVKVLDLSNITDLSWKSLPSLPVPLSNAHAFIIKDELHVVGGETGSITSAAHYVLNLLERSKGWKFLIALPYPVSHGILLQDKQKNRLLLLGGRAKIKDKPSVFYQSAVAFDLTTNQWNDAEPLPYPLAAGTGIALQDGVMLIFGGDQGTIFNQVEECLIKAARSSDSHDIESWNQIRKALQSSHPGFSRAVLKWDANKSMWTESERLPFATPVTTQAVCSDQYLVIPGGEIRAGVRTANFYYIKLKSS
jgi:N-acetylneuraminic acid mutarotase